MSETQAQDKGVLVIHEDGAVAWWSPSAPAVASVHVGIGVGAVVEVDAANPSVVVGWGLQAGGDVESLARAFGEPQLAENLRLLAGTGQDVFTKSAPTLTQPWVRRATVAAVSQCTQRPMNESALLLDQASADRATGREELAVSLFQMAAPSLLDLGAECLAGQIGGGAATDIARIADEAAQSLQGSGWEPDVVELSARLQSEVGLTDADLDAVMALFEMEEAAARKLAPAHMDRTETRVDDEFYIDPRAVPPRLLAWPGGALKDLRVKFSTDSNQVVVSADLADSADERSVEASELVAYAADPEKGSLIAVAPMHVEGHTVTATVLCGRDPKSLHYGLYHADTDPEALRLDAVGRLLVEVDRRMLDAYHHYRLALAAVHEHDVVGAVEEMEAKRKRELDQAASAALDASDLLDEFLDDNDVSDDAAALLRRRKAAIDAFRDGLAAGLLPADGAETLLSELLPPDINDSAGEE